MTGCTPAVSVRSRQRKIRADRHRQALAFGNAVQDQRYTRVPPSPTFSSNAFGCWPATPAPTATADTVTVIPLCYRRIMAVRKKRSISIPPELDAAIAAAAQDAGMSYSAWITQTARKEFIIQAGLEAVSKYESEHGPFTPDEIAEADEWAARITQPPAARRTA